MAADSMDEIFLIVLALALCNPCDLLALYINHCDISAIARRADSVHVFISNYFRGPFL